MMQPRKTAVTFRYDPRHKTVGEVFLVGGFNEWRPDATPMFPQSGRFVATQLLGPGTYEYKFVVDGHWEADARASRRVPDGFGSFNSLVTVEEPGEDRA